MNRLATVAHAGFQQPEQMLKRLRQNPVLQGRRLVERAGLLLKQRQIVHQIGAELADDHQESGWRAIWKARQRIATLSTNPFTSTSRKP